MKNEYFVILSLGLLGISSFGHDQIVHQTITANAIDSAMNYSPAFQNFLNVIFTDQPFEDAKRRMVAGSFNEDFGPDSDLVGGYRSLNHFYDPLTGLGLSDFPTDIQLEPFGNDSFTWASTLDCPGIDFRPGGFRANVNTQNKWSWKNARDYEWHGLTDEDQGDRQNALLNMFRSVGQVVHLLQDTSQPQHVRNEQHLSFGSIPSPWKSPIEDYGEKHVELLDYELGVLDWRAAGFKKLKDFWDRQLYDGTAVALNADVNGGAKLGLAEFSNGNFLGARHLYSEYYEPDSVKYHPLPSRDHSTDYLQKRQHLASGVESFSLKNGDTGKAIYLNKVQDGVSIAHHSRFTYFGAKFPRFGMITINDPNVLQDYHSILIPKAVEYSAGILDYFFRGQLEVTLRCGTTPGMRGLAIKNISGDKLLGGTFKLFWDSNGDRTELTGQSFTTSYTGSLDDDATTTAEFTPQASAEKYVLVYIGTVGADGTTPHDDVDQNIAIAATTITMPVLEFVPEWGSLSGTTGFSGSKTFSPVNAAGAAFSSVITVAATGGPTTANIIQATVVWDGPAGVCNLHLDLDYHKTGTASIFGEVKVNGNFIFGLDSASGSYDIPFALACGQETPVTIQIDFRSVVGVSTGSADATVNGEFTIVDP